MNHEPSNPQPHNPLLRQREQLRAVAAVEQTKLNDLIVVAEAESVVTTSRHSELQELTQAARRRVTAAKGQLTRARRDGNAGKIAAARVRLDTAEADWERVTDAAMEEIQATIRAKLDGLSAMNAQIDVSWAAQAAVTDTYRRPPGSPDRSA